MTLAFDTATLWIVVAIGIATAILVAVDIVLLVRRRRTGEFGNLVTWIDTILLFAGLPALVGFYVTMNLYEKAAVHYSEVIHLWLNSIMLIQICGFLFIASFYAWALLRLMYNRVLDAEIASPAAVSRK